MAPEIREMGMYDGRQADLFSFGVIIFVLVIGTFPFTEASPNEFYYNLLCSGQSEKYFEKVKA